MNAMPHSNLMKHPRAMGLFALVVAVGVLAVIAYPAAAADTAIATAPTATSAATSAAPESRAVTVATGIAQITGLAISPLLVLVAIGWSDYTALGTSAAAPLHANPWFLVPCSIVLALALLKKCASPAIPLPIRKLLDAGEYLEAKLAALIAAGVLLPTIISTMTAATGGTSNGASGGATISSATTAPLAEPVAHVAGFMDPSWMSSLLADTSVFHGVLLAVVIAAAIAIFVSVWITFHVIDALIVLSPFAIVDAALVALRGSILGVLALALLIHPFIALVFALPIIALSFLFAGWCIRLDLFACTVASDLLFARKPVLNRPRAFLARGDLGAPIRTMGHAESTPNGVRFTYHPLFVLPARTLEIPVSSRELVHGLVWPTLADNAQQKCVIAFPPRYRMAVDELAKQFDARIREGRLRTGVRRLREGLAALASVLRGESTAQV